MHDHSVSENFRPMRKLLSICVPTYNRSTKLRFLYEQFLEYASGAFASTVEVLVSDNSDAEHADKNQELFTRTLIRYVRNGKNIGYAGNLIQCAELCMGEYIWIISDDDPILALHFSELLKLIEKPASRPDCVFIPYYNENIFSDRLIVNRGIDWGNCQHFGDLLNRSGVPFTLLSSAVVKIDRSVFGLAKQYSQNDYVHMILFLAMLRKESKISYLPNPLIDYRRNYDFPCSIVRMADSMRDVFGFVFKKFAIRKSLKRDHEAWLLWLFHERGGLYSFRASAADRVTMRRRTIARPTVKGVILTALLQLPLWIFRPFYPFYITYKENLSFGHTAGYKYFKRVQAMRNFIRERKERGE